MWNKAKAILLASNKVPERNDLVLLASNKELVKMTESNVLDWIDSESTASKVQHLYIINEDVIKVNDWYLSTDKIEQCFSKEEANDLTSNCKKIIATTNKSLGITDYRVSPVPNFCDFPQIPQSFIEQYITEYNQGKMIIDVFVEYIDYCNKLICNNALCEHGCIETDIKLKVNPKDNTINIRTIKDSFNREEVEVLLFNLAEHYGMTSAKSEIDDFNIWISENL